MGVDWQSAWVEVAEETRRLVLRLGGELDRVSRDAIEPAIMAAIATADAVILDLGDLTSCDSLGVAMFIAANEKAQADGTSLTFRNLHPRVWRVFRIYGVDQLLDIDA